MASPVLGERKTERRGKSLRDCILGLCDEVCIYHRENDIYDHVLKVGLRILKVQPVESKQPRTTCFARSAGQAPLLTNTQYAIV